jgi:hypothetical protein
VEEGAPISDTEPARERLCATSAGVKIRARQALPPILIMVIGTAFHSCGRGSRVMVALAAP